MNSEKILSIFKEITRIPRESGHEEKIVEYLVNFAKEHGLEYKTDDVNNVVITRPASKGYEDRSTIVLQGHTDMVCEKNAGVEHDFAKDPIRYVIEDGWMIAKDTTLGADCGIGVAAQLAALIDPAPCGKIECLFTSSEETGMDGAFGLKPGFITGKTLINLDSEDEGELFIGCAGGLDTTAVFSYIPESLPADAKCFSVRIFNGVGGHSGDDINKGRANAVQLLARFLNDCLSSADFKLSLCCIDGGNKRNAIARESSATVALTGDEAAPHGVLSMSADIPGLVETSTNLASVKMLEGNKIRVGTSQRSSITSARRAAAAKVEASFLLAGAEVTHEGEYPGWKPTLDSEILRRSVASYKKLFGVEPAVKAIHAGLECGLFLEIYPDLDMISFGPTLRGVHAPGERLDLASLDKFTLLLDDILHN